MTKVEFLEESHRKQYLEHYILKIFGDQIKKYKSDYKQNFFLSHIAFLINGVQNETTALREVLKFRTGVKDKSSFKQKQVMNYFLKLTSDQFKISFEKKQISNQLFIVNSILFDEELQKCGINFKQCLSEKNNFLEIISKEFVNLETILTLAKSLQRKRDKLEVSLLKLLKINNKNFGLLTICEGFHECLTIALPFYDYISQFGKNNKVPKTLLPHSGDAAAIFISMLTNIGTIRKVSTNFSSVLPLAENNQTAIGKNVRFIMCDEIANVHDLILFDHLNKKQFNQQIVEYPLMIAKSKNGWALPLHLKIQMCLIGDTDIGACAQIQSVGDGDMYIQTSSTNEGLKILLIDEMFSSIFFNEQFTLLELKKIRLGKLAPLLQVIIDKGKKCSTYETIIIQPLNMADAQSKRDIYEDSFLSNLFKSNLFLMKFIAFPFNNKQVQFVQIQVSSIKELADYNSKKEAIKNYILQMKEFIDFSKLKKNFAKALSSLNFSYSKEKSFSSLFQIKEDHNANLSTVAKTNIEEHSDSYLRNDKYKRPTLDALNSDIPKSMFVQTDFINSQENEAVLESQSESATEINGNLLISLQKEQTNKSHMSELLIDKIGIALPQIGILFQDGESSKHIQKKTKSIISFKDSLQISRQNHNETQSLQLLSIENQQNFDSFPISPLSNRPLLQLNSIDNKANSKQITYQSLPNQFTSQNPYLPDGDMILSKTQKQIREQQNSLGQNQKQGIHDQLSSGSFKFQEEKNQPIAVEEYENSVQSVNSQRSVTKAQLMKQIRLKNKSRGLKIINFIGIVSILIVAILNIASFIVIENDALNQKDNFLQIFWCFQTKRYFGYAMGVVNLYKGLVSGFYAFPASPYLLGFIKQVYIMKIYIYQGLRNTTLQMLEGNPNNIFVFENAMNTNIEFSYMNSIRQQIDYNSTQSFYYKIIQWTNAAYYMLNNTDTNNLNYQTTYFNYDNSLIAFDTIYENNRQNFNDNISNSNIISISVLLIISIVTGILALMMIPIYTINQQNREEILKLFATFSVDRIILMSAYVQFYKEKLDNLDSLLNGSQNILSKQHNSRSPSNQRSLFKSQISSKFINMKKSTTENIRQRDGMKKRNVSNTSRLPKFNLGLIPGLCFCLCCALFNPFASFYIEQRHQQQFKDSIQLLTSMDYFVDNVSQLYTLKVEFTFMKLSNPTSTQLSHFSNLMEANRNKTQRYYNEFVLALSVYETKDIFQRELYDSFLLPIFKGDLCTTLQNSNMNFREVSLNYTICKSLLNGMLTEGFFVSCKETVSILDNFYQVSLLSDLNQFKIGFLNIQKQMLISVEYTFLTYVAFVSKILHYFFEDRYLDYYNYIHNLSVYFLITQIILLFLILSFGWNKFYFILGEQLLETKKLLDIINIDALLDNSYVMSFMKKSN